MGSNAPYELIEGVLREVSPSSPKTSVIGMRIGGADPRAMSMLDSFGYVTNADGGYILNPNPATVVAPDVGFYRGDRYPGGMPDRGLLPLPPDLAVEVISPTDRKVGHCGEAGTVHQRRGSPRLVGRSRAERR